MRLIVGEVAFGQQSMAQAKMGQLKAASQACTDLAPCGFSRETPLH
jgi:hypothetical protein